MAIKDKDIVKLHPNERIDLPDLRALQDNARSESREFLQACVMSGEYVRQGQGQTINNDTEKGSGWLTAQATNLKLGYNVDSSGYNDANSGYHKNFVVKPFRLSAPANGSSLTVTAGVATTGLYDTDGTPGTEHGVVAGLTGDAHQTLDTSAFALGTWHYIYVTTTLDDTTPSSRVFWNNTASNEVGQTVTTRKAFNWQIKYSVGFDAEATDKGYILVGNYHKNANGTVHSCNEVTYMLGEGHLNRAKSGTANATTLTGHPVYHHDYKLDGTLNNDAPANSGIYEPLAWGDGANDRNHDRLTYGCHSLAEFLDAVRRQLSDIIGSDKWGTPNDGRAWYDAIPLVTSGPLDTKEGNLSNFVRHASDDWDPHGTVLRQTEIRLVHLRGHTDATTIQVDSPIWMTGPTDTITLGDTVSQNLVLSSTSVLAKTAAVTDGGGMTTVRLDKAEVTIDRLVTKATLFATPAILIGDGGTDWAKWYASGEIEIQRAGDYNTAIDAGGLVKANQFIAQKSAVPPISYASGTTRNVHRFVTGAAFDITVDRQLNVPVANNAVQTWSNEWSNNSGAIHCRNEATAFTTEICQLFQASAYGPASYPLVPYDVDAGAVPRLDTLRIYYAITYQDGTNLGTTNCLSLQLDRRNLDGNGVDALFKTHTTTSIGLNDAGAGNPYGIVGTENSQYFALYLNGGGSPYTTAHLASQSAEYVGAAPGSIMNNVGANGMNHTVVTNVASVSAGGLVSEHGCITIDLDGWASNGSATANPRAEQLTMEARYPTHLTISVYPDRVNDTDFNFYLVGADFMARCSALGGF
jgi:hypothetical protein